MGLVTRGWQVGPGIGAMGVRAVSGCDAGLLGARGADRWGRRLRRVARGASPAVERACWAGSARGRGPLRRWAGADRAGLGGKEVGRGLVWGLGLFSIFLSLFYF